MCGRLSQNLTWQQIYTLYTLPDTTPRLDPETPVQRCAHPGFRALPAGRKRDEILGRASMGAGAVLGQRHKDRRADDQRPGRDRPGKSRPSDRLSERGGASSRRMDGSNGSGPGRTGAASNHISWRSRVVRRLPSPRCGSNGAVAASISKRSPSSRPKLRPNFRIYTIGSPRWSIRTISPNGSTPVTPVETLQEIITTPHEGPYEIRSCERPGEPCGQRHAGHPGAAGEANAVLKV